jgi:hypothetical protein
MPDAKIERATDVLVQITSTNICGSDLHMYEGRTSMEPGRILVMRISAWSSRWVWASIVSRSAIASVCRSTSAAAFARAVKKA